MENKTISKDEAKRLKQLLEIEEQDGKQNKKWQLLITIGFILGVIALILYDD